MYQKNELLVNLSPEQGIAILQACSLSEVEEYTDDEADRFKEARALVEQGKTYEEVAVHFQKQQGQPETNSKGKKSAKTKQKAAQNDESEPPLPAPSREQIMEQIHQLVTQAGGLSAEEFAQLLPALANQRQAELIEMFDRGLLARLSNMAETGELEQIVRQTSAGKKSLPKIPSLFMEVEVVEELPPSSPRLLSESSDSKSSS